MIKTKNSNIYIVMYHYVREIKKSKFRNLKGLEFKDFKKQINFFIKHFNIISHNDLVEILRTKKIPKKKSILLTFDDGYIDHWKYVFPYLKEKKITGNFYPPVQVIKNNKMLDVNKIHFILEKELDRKKILKSIFKYTNKYLNKDENSLNLNKIETKNRYDDKETVIIKRLLQTHLPLKIREKITNKIFNEIVNHSEESFSKKLYMDTKNIKEMFSNKMSFGSHGNNHYWWENLSNHDQERELKTSINFFKSIKVYDSNFSVCYPYGSYNLNTIKMIKKNNIKFALTTRVGSLNKRNIRNNFELPRHDTNDFKNH
jgi:peptidoglycan/xylan/chitin deacetylase (PgdA/CDA1 family)